MSDPEKTNVQVVAEDVRQTRLDFGQFVDVVAPWLLELGSWIFGALIAFNLVILSAVLTVGPVDNAMTIAMASFALALPVDVAGFLLLRLVTDMRKIRFQEVAEKAFEEAGFGADQATPGKNAERKFQSVTLRYTYTLMSLAILLTLAGITAALWHGAWWIGVAFLVMALLTQTIVLAAMSELSGGRDRWRPRDGRPAKPS